MTNFPVVNTLDADTFKVGSEDPAIPEAKMEGGYVISRPRFTRRPRRTFSFSFVDMTDADMNALQDFWDLVMGSSDAFNWTHPTTGAVYNVRFTAATKMDFTRDGYGAVNRWKSSPISLQEV